MFYILFIVNMCFFVFRLVTNIMFIEILNYLEGRTVRICVSFVRCI